MLASARSFPRLALFVSFVSLASFAPLAGAQATFGPTRSIPYPTLGSIHYDLTSGRLNGDCYPDVVVTSRGIVEGLGVYLGGPDGLTNPGAFVPMTSTTNGPTVKSAVIVDLDMDGIGEIFALQGTDMRIVDFDGATFTPGPSTPAPIPAISERVRACDVDGDGDQDLVMIGWNGGAGGGIAVLRSDGHGGLSQSYASPGGNPTSFVLADFDGDGRPDLATTHPSPPRVEVRLNAGGATFAAPFVLPLPFLEWVDDIDAFDQDHDGDLDLVMDSIGAMLTAYNINGSQFQVNNQSYARYPAFVPVTSFVRFADLDRDGDVDAAIHNPPTLTSWLWNDPGDAFATLGLPAAGVQCPILAVDLDRNGYLDLVSAGYEVQYRMNVTGSNPAGLAKMATAVNGGPFDATSKTFTSGDTISFGTDIAGEPCMAGRPAAIIVNGPPYSTQTAVTPLTNNFFFPNLSILSPWSQPAGVAIFCGNSLYALPPIPGFVDAGFGPLHLGDAPFSVVMPAGLLGPGDKLRFQAIYYDPIPNQNVVTLGLFATNAVELVKN